MDCLEDEGKKGKNSVAQGAAWEIPYDGGRSGMRWNGMLMVGGLSTYGLT